jgi:hypothetical protein
LRQNWRPDWFWLAAVFPGVPEKGGSWSQVAVGTAVKKIFSDKFNIQRAETSTGTNILL